MRKQEWGPEQITHNIHKANLQPDGTLFVIHDYEKKGYKTAGIVDKKFAHYPLPRYSPPADLHVPILDYDFLIATKIFAIREPGRGGERFKDAYDLSTGLSQANPHTVIEKLEAYRNIRGEDNDTEELLRQSGNWVHHFLNRGNTLFQQGLRRFVPESASAHVGKRLAEALEIIEEMYGNAIRPAPWEARRFLLVELTPKKLGPIAKALGYHGHLDREFEKMADFLAKKAIPHLDGPVPESAEQLLAELRGLV